MDVRLSVQQTQFHRYRIAVIESWPDNPRKQSALVSARAALAHELAYEHDLSEALNRTSAAGRSRRRS